MSILIDKDIAPEKLKDSYIALYQSNCLESNTAPTRVSQFTLFSKPFDSFDRVQSETYNLVLIREWRALLLNKPVKPITLGTTTNQLKLTMLTLMGTLYFACEGFDGMTALLGIFSLPATLLMASGLVFSILSVIIFYSFDLVEISKNLGVSWRQTPALIDLYVDQLSEMKALINAMHSEIKNNNLSTDDKTTCIGWLQQLEVHYRVIEEQSMSLQNQLDRPIINAAQTAVTVLAGLIHFSGGFFAGQTVMIALCSAMTLSTSPTFLPILAFSVFIGFAALSIYWYVEKPGIEKFVSRWVGIDGEKLEAIKKPGRIENKLSEVHTLKTALSIFNQAANDTFVGDRTAEASPQSLHV